MQITHQLCLFIFIIIIECCLGLRDVSVVIPLAVEKSHKAIMKCMFDLEGEALYSVKWYKSQREFFRYIPKENPSIKHFPINGLKVVEYQSNSTQLVLDDVQPENSDTYCCEITVDNVGFYTGIVCDELRVIILPREGPKITKIKNKYRVGEVLRGQCTSKDSIPGANLTWYVNGKPGRETDLRHQKPKPDVVGLEIAISHIQKTITQELFSEGRLKIKCSAIIYDVYHRSSEMSIELDKPKPEHYVTTTTPATIGFSEGAIQDLEAYPHNTSRLSPMEETTPSGTLKLDFNLPFLIVILLCLFQLVNLR